MYFHLYLLRHYACFLFMYTASEGVGVWLFPKKRPTEGSGNRNGGKQHQHLWFYLHRSYVYTGDGRFILVTSQ